MTHDLVTLIEEAPEAFLDEIQDWLALVHDVGISQSALHENIWDCGLTYKMLWKAAAERPDNKKPNVNYDGMSIKSAVLTENFNFTHCDRIFRLTSSRRTWNGY